MAADSVDLLHLSISYPYIALNVPEAGEISFRSEISFRLGEFQSTYERQTIVD